MNHSSKSHGRSSETTIMVMLTALALVVALLAWLFPLGRGNRGTVAVQTPPIVLPPTSAAPELPVPSPSEEVEVPARPVESWLADLDPASDNSDIDAGEVRMGGKDYFHSLLYVCELFCNDGPKGSETYVLSKEYKTFEAVIGVDDGAEEEQIGVFEVVLDGRAAGTWRVPIGRPKRIKVDVSGVLRIRLEAYRPGTVGNPALAGAGAAAGVSGRFPDLAWGDARVTG